MLGAATTLQSQSPQHSEVGALLLAMGSEATKGAVMPAPKVAPLPTQIFMPLKFLMVKKPSEPMSENADATPGKSANAIIEIYGNPTTKMHEFMVPSGHSFPRPRRSNISFLSFSSEPST
jgi:hypothetical protein